MAEQILESYKSRRNCAQLIQTPAGRFVRKTFAEESSFQKELQIYELLHSKKIACARVIEAGNKTLLLSQLPGKNLVDCLQQQEQLGKPIWSVWEKLVQWMTAFHKETGLAMTDVNLRNFIYDETENMLYGLDFEECEVCDMLISAAGVAAFIRTYAPENTPLKQEISQYVLNMFASNCRMEVDALARESERQERKLLERRKNKI